MRKSKGKEGASSDPFQFDTLLSIFHSPEQFQRATAADASLAPSKQPILAEKAGDSGGDSVFAALKGSIENHPLPCLIVSEGGKIVSLNAPAYAAFDLEISDDIDNCGLETFDNEMLATKINDVITSVGQGRQTSFCRAFYQDKKRPVTLTILPNRTPDNTIKTALVFFVDIGRDGAIGDFISSAYDLTQSEQQVLEMFILGEDLEQIAESRGRSFQTVRTQFYSALSKCGLTSQVDLVREIVAGSLFQSLLPHSATNAEHPHRKELTLLRPKGRTLEVIMAGDFEGAPVIMLASMGVQKFAPQKSRKMFDASVCVYSISPPGYGQTSPPPNGQDRLDCLKEDVGFVLDQLNLQAAPFISFAQSVIPTLRLARLMPQRVKKVLSFLTIPPPRYQKQNGGGETVSALAAVRNAVLSSPTTKGVIIKSAIRAWSVFGTRKMVKIQCRAEPSAAPFLLDPETVKSIDEGFQSAIFQGFSEVSRDTAAIYSDWSPHVETCPVPITFVHGKNDKTNDIEAVRAFAGNFPKQVDLMEIDEAGAFLHVTHEDLYIEILQDFAQT